MFFDLANTRSLTISPSERNCFFYLPILLYFSFKIFLLIILRSFYSRSSLDVLCFLFHSDNSLFLNELCIWSTEIFLFFLTLNQSQYRISSPLMRENPVKRPIIPPTQEILSENDIRALLVICKYSLVLIDISLYFYDTLVMMKSFGS